jgi:hypothetical protein
MFAAFMVRSLGSGNFEILGFALQLIRMIAASLRSKTLLIGIGLGEHLVKRGLYRISASAPVEEISNLEEAPSFGRSIKWLQRLPFVRDLEPDFEGAMVWIRSFVCLAYLAQCSDARFNGLLLLLGDFVSIDFLFHVGSFRCLFRELRNGLGFLQKHTHP